LEITYLGRSAFRLRGKEVTVVTDPFPPDRQHGMGKPQADVVTVSHPDPHHCFVEGVGGVAKRIDGPGEYEVADILIAGVATASQAMQGAANTAYVLRFDDLAVCHLGAIRSKLDAKQIEEIGNVDILLVPVGGNGALGPAVAAEVVHQLEPRIVVPMEYRINGHDAQREPVDHFVREMGSKEFATEPKLTVTRNSLPQDLRVVVLETRRV
jgi:L-ascorbate metabolism protein UlaG (beta-lactamase superfamily)